MRYNLRLTPDLQGRIAALCCIALILTVLSACGGSASSVNDAPAPTPINTPNNTAALSINSGPAGSGVNRLYTTITVCTPGSTSQCVLLDHVLVDTGSVGLRVLASELTVALPRSRAASGQALFNCAQFLDNTSAWGPVATADVRWGTKVAAAMPIQVIADPSTGAPANICAAGSVPLTDVSALGARGILGVGLFKEDCGARCAEFVNNGFYYTCSNATCSSVVGSSVPRAQQVQHPVPLFASDNNGIVIDLPPAAAQGTDRLDGMVVFGIGTQSNNQPGTSRVLTTDTAGNIRAVFAGRSLSISVLDTGSNGNYFDGGGLPLCARSSDFYCPPAPTTLEATLVGANGVSALVPFVVSDSLQTSAAVRPGLAGPIGDPRIFNFGLPFFLGRKVMVGIEGSVTPLGSGPLYAF